MSVPGFHRAARAASIVLAVFPVACAGTPEANASVLLPTLREIVSGTAPRLERPQVEPLRPSDFLAAADSAGATPRENPAAAAVLSLELQAHFLDFVQAFEMKRAEDSGVVARIDAAAARVEAGEFAEAIEGMLRIEAEYPGLYRTALMLGRAHELAGALDEAALWMARAVERKPRGFVSADWLRLSILVAKLRFRGDATWFDHHHVLEGVEHRPAAEVLRALEDELRVRVRLVRPRDPVVCDLFYQAALRLPGAAGQERRAAYLRESLRFGDWRRSEIVALTKT